MAELAANDTITKGQRPRTLGAQTAVGGGVSETITLNTYNAHEFFQINMSTFSMSALILVHPKFVS